MAKTGAARSAQLNRARVARWYRRQHEPARIVLRVELAHAKLLEKLISSGWISERDCWDRVAVETALSLLLESSFEFPRRKP